LVPFNLPRPSFSSGHLISSQYLNSLSEARGFQCSTTCETFEGADLLGLQNVAKGVIFFIAPRAGSLALVVIYRGPLGHSSLVISHGRHIRFDNIVVVVVVVF